MKTIIFAIVALAPLGCGSIDNSIYDLHETPSEGGASSPGPQSNTGSVDADTCVVQGSASVTGMAFSARDAIEVFDPTKGTFTFFITDYANACSFGNGVHAGSNVIAIEYAKQALGSGAYDITKTAGLKITQTHYDSACKATQSEIEVAESGSLTFEKLDACGGEGSFDLAFGATNVKAAFTASVCDVPSGPATCH